MGKKRTLIAEAIREKIRTGCYSPGFRIGSVRTLAKEFSVAPGTAARSVSILVQEGILRSEARQGFFVCKSCKNPVIGYTGHLMAQYSDKPLLSNAVSRMFDFLMHCSGKLNVIPHQELTTPEQAALKFRDIDVFLFNTAFLNCNTERVLFNCPKKAVLYGSTYAMEALSCSQVIPDLLPALKKFNRRYPFDQYRKFLILRPPHNNAQGLYHQMETFFEFIGVKDRIELFSFDGFGSHSAELAAYRHFCGMKQSDLRDTLVISLSDYCSMGIYEAGKVNGWFPDILSCDNLEALVPDLVDAEPYFTSIDWKLAQCYRTAAELAVKLADGKDTNDYIVRIPSDIVFRKSVRGVNAK